MPKFVEQPVSVSYVDCACIISDQMLSSVQPTNSDFCMGLMSVKCPFRGEISSHFFFGIDIILRFCNSGGRDLDGVHDFMCVTRQFPKTCTGLMETMNWSSLEIFINFVFSVVTQDTYESSRDNCVKPPCMMIYIHDRNMLTRCQCVYNNPKEKEGEEFFFF